MILNKPLKTAIAFILTVSAFSTSNAATDSTEITLSHTYEPYVTFTGTAPGASRFYDNNDVVPILFGALTNLGTLGLDSNVGGNCNINFTTVNNFALKHTENGNIFGDYNIEYKNNTFGKSSNSQLELPCTSDATDLNFIITGPSLGGNDLLLAAGVYQDIVSVVVTTQ